MYDYCLPKQVDYGVRIKGNVDRDSETLPLQLSMDDWSEPDYSKEDGRHEAPTMLSGTLRATQLLIGQQYSILRFESPEHVPSRDFLRGNWQHKINFVAVTSNHGERVSFMSNSTIFYRCVKG